MRNKPADPALMGAFEWLAWYDTDLLPILDALGGYQRYVWKQLCAEITLLLDTCERIKGDLFDWAKPKVTWDTAEYVRQKARRYHKEDPEWFRVYGRIRRQLQYADRKAKAKELGVPIYQVPRSYGAESLAVEVTRRILGRGFRENVKKEPTKEARSTGFSKVNDS